MVAHVLSLNTGTAAVLDALTTPNGVTGMLALDTSDSNRPRLFEGTLGGRKLAWLDEVALAATSMNITASNATNPTALQNLTGSILSYSGSTLSLQSGKTLDLSAGASNNLGTPTTLVLTNATGLPVSTGISGLGTGVATFLATPSSANLASAITDETGTAGKLVFDTGPTISALTLTGNTTLPGSGQLSSAGSLGLGGAPSSQFSLAGSIATSAFDISSNTTSAGANFASIAGTFVSSLTTGQNSFSITTTLSPSGVSLNNLRIFALTLNLSNSSTNITSASGVQSSVTISASYSGNLSTINCFVAPAPSLSGTGTISNYNAYQAGGHSVNNGLTTGTVNNRQFYAGVITSGAAGATINNRGIEVTVPSGGASSGTANNRGIYITGNGGTASGGTVNNFALYSDSTANSRILGFLGIGGDPSAQLHLQGNISAAAWTTNGIKIRGGSSTLTDTSSSGTVAAAYTNALGGNTIAASSATTYTNYFGLYITDPTAGSNVTMTNKYAFGADSAKITTLTLASTTLLITTVALTNGAGALTGTLTNSPATGDPTKWIPINDNGTTRYIPAW